jgi:hypothetical protein
LRAVEETDTVDRRGGRVLLESLFLPRTPEPFEMHTVFLSFAGAGSAGPSSDDSVPSPARTPPIGRLSPDPLELVEPVPSGQKAIFPNPLPAKGLFLPPPIRTNAEEIPNPSARPRQ